MQLHLEKTYDHVDHMSFALGPPISHHIFLLGQNATSWVMLKGGVTSKIPLTRLVQQGCPLSTLLFAIVTHSLLVMLLRKILVEKF